jgi:photosystem II stability/assembly factor-like uncharacterized protein
MKKLIVIFIIAFSGFVCSQSGWQGKTTPVGSYFNTIYFLNNNTGWLATDHILYSTILKTTNNGSNWSIMTNSLNISVTDIQFINELTGWCVASSGCLRKTTDGGSNWFFMNCPECNNVDDFLKVQFLNENTGYAFGDWRIFKSTDGGLNWSPFELYLFSILRGQFINPSTGWVCGSGGFAKTTNGGINWVQNNFTNNWTTELYFLDINTGWICSRKGEIFKTTDGGINWTQQYKDTTKYFNNITFTSINTGWAIGEENVGSPYNGFVLKTTNSGQTWFNQQVPHLHYYKIHMFNSNEGWIVGDTLLYTTDGGGSVGVQQISSEIPEKFKLHQNYPNPFNASTIISYDISKSTLIKLEVFDIAGKKIKTLDEGFRNAGKYEIIFNANELASGIYYYKITTEKYIETKKFVLIK